MELTSSMNMNCRKGHHGLDGDDVFSNISRISCDLKNSLNSTSNSTYNSDSECSQPISVRNMIQHYNNQFMQSESNSKNSTFKINSAKRYHHPSQHLLAATKSSYCGLNNYGAPTNYNEFADQIAHDNHNNNCCKNCTACTCCRNRSRKNSTTSKILSSSSSSFLLLQPNENDQKPNNDFNMNYNNTSGCSIRSSNTNCNKINAKDTHILAVENCSNINDDAGAADVVADINDDTTIASSNNPTILNDFCAEQKDSSNNDLFKNHNSQNVVELQKNHLLSIDSGEEANICQQVPAETSYQSKTTIAKTSSGVRIIIDIFFDQERCNNATDIVGSRVETDIPQSRILNEFEQQAMAANADASFNSYQGM